jgi:peptidyl-prolyl cis-trans isomerase D
MLQRIRDHVQGPVAWVLLGALALVFAAWGAYGIVDVGFGPTAYAAKVNGERVSLEEVNRAWMEQQAQIAQAFGGEFPAEQRAELQRGLLDGIITRTLLTARAEELGYRITATQLRQAIESEPAFQIDGKYNANIAKARLAQVGLSPDAFERDLRGALMRQELQRGIGISNFLTPQEFERAVALEDEEREVRFAVFSAADFAPATIDAAAIQAFYDANAARFMTPESVRLAFGDLRLDQVAAGVVVAEEDLRALYDKDQDRYVEQEKRRARHILVEDEAQAADIAAKAKAGQDFGALATEFSLDSGSAKNAGDLGWAERSFFEAPFSDALFAMQEGQVSDPVKTRFGYHVIRLDGIQAGRAKSFEDARAELDAQFRSEQAAVLFGDRGEDLAAAVAAPGADFDSLVKQFGLTTGEVAEFVRGAGGVPLGSAPELDEIVFGDTVLNQRQLGGPIPLGEDRYVIVKVLEHRKAAPRPIAEVRDDIVAALKLEKGLEAARAAADADLARLAAGESFDVVGKGRRVTGPVFVGRNDPSVSAEVRARTFVGPAPARALVDLADGAAVVEVIGTRASAAQMTDETRRERLFQLANRASAGDVAAYVAEALRTADITRNPKAFE